MASVEDLLPKPGDVIAGKYRVERTLGTGGMGAVYEVVHTVTNKRFAVKWLLPSLASSKDAVARFIREAQVAGRVQHPNVVEIYDVGEESDSFYMVMELLQGETLSDRMARRGKLPAAEVCALLLPVLSGVSAAHAAGVVHRDLKPENIFACQTPTGQQVLKVLDFGISKMEQVGDTSLTATRAGTVMGTPHYMAAEQVRSLPVDARTDVYAIGVILYEMLAGVVPFAAQSYGDLVLQILTDVPTPLKVLAPETPQALIDIVSQAMAREPDKRFPSVDALARALTPFAGGAVLTPMPSDWQAAPSSTNAPGTLRPKTPLSTESTLERTGPRVANAPRKLPVALMLVLTVAAIAVLGLAIVAVRLLTRDEVVATPTEVEPAHPTTSHAAELEIPLGVSSDSLDLPPLQQPAAEPIVAKPATEAPPVVEPVADRTAQPSANDKPEPRARPSRHRAPIEATPRRDRTPAAPAITTTPTKRRTSGLTLDDF